MPQERLPMRKIRDVLRLKAGGSSKRKIAASLGISPTAVGECVRRARRACLSWPLPASLDDETLENRLYPPPAITSKNKRPQPDWPTIHRELKRPGVTLQLIWEEHRAQHPAGYGYSRFCDLYRAWEKRLSAAAGLPSADRRGAAGANGFAKARGRSLSRFRKKLRPSPCEGQPDIHLPSMQME